MDVEKSRTLLSEILSHLPEGVWFMLHERNIGDAGLASALQRSPEEIEALLINTMVYKETAKRGTQFVAGQWEIYRQQHIDPSSIKVGDRDRVVYVLNGEPIFDSPSMQEQNSKKLRKIRRATELPGDIIDELIESHELYKKNKNAKDSKKNAKEGTATKAANKKKDSSVGTATKADKKKDSDVAQSPIKTNDTNDGTSNIDTGGDRSSCDPGDKRDISYMVNSIVNGSNLSTQSGSECVHIDDTTTKESKRAKYDYDRCQIRTNAAALLAPLYTKQSIEDIERMDWDTTKLKDVAKSQQCEDEKDA